MASWKSFKTVKTGISHYRNNTPCQDAVCIYENKDYIIAALADGLGSLPYSEIASHAVTDGIVRSFVNLSTKQFAANISSDRTLEEFKRIIINKSQSMIKKAAYEHGLSESEMNCTLLFICINKRSNLAVIGQIGDGAICTLYNDHADLFAPPEKEIANGTATIMGCSDTDIFLEVIDINADAINGFILTSDGLENELYFNFGSVKQIAAEYFNAIQLEPSQAQQKIDELIANITMSSASVYDDDISLAIISRANRNVYLPEDVNWLCQCGKRNGLQHTRCPYCDCDIVDLHDSLSYSEYGGKLATLTWLNEHPEEEKRVVDEYISMHRNESYTCNEDFHDNNLSGTGRMQHGHNRASNQNYRTNKDGQTILKNPKNVVTPEIFTKKFNFRQVILIASIFFLIGALSVFFCFSCKESCTHSSGGNAVVSNDALNQLVSSPCNNIECIDTNYAIVKSMLTNAGFENITVLPNYDLGYGENSRINSVASISIDGCTNFNKGQKFSKSSEVVITYHDMKQCEVNITVDFDGNMLLYKYDVDFYIGDDKIDTLNHGEDKNYPSITLSPGDYKIKFTNPRDPSQTGEAEVKIIDDSKLRIDISCDWFGVNVKCKTTVIEEE